MESVEPRPYHLTLPSRPWALATLGLWALLGACQPAAPQRVETGGTTAVGEHELEASGDTVRPDGESLARPANMPSPSPDADESSIARDKAEQAAALTEAEPPASVAAAPAPPAEAKKAAIAEGRVDDMLSGSLRARSGGHARSPRAVQERLVRGDVRRSAPRPAPKRKAPSGIVALGGVGTGHGYGSGGGRALQLAAPIARPAPQDFNTEAYAHVSDNPFHQVGDQPLSTFSIDVDTASYSNVRRFLTSGTLPPADAVRIEEMVNYFSYNYEAPSGPDPFSVNTEVSVAPWNPRHRLVHIGLQGRKLADADVPARNLVFLLDVSGSMNRPDKLPLLKRGMGMLARQLRPQDRIAIVVYAGASGLVLSPTGGANQHAILGALERLQAGGSTNGADGIQLAYRVAHEGFIAGGINRVILATDGDFNVGVTNQGDLTRLIENKRKSGVFLTVLGFGTGNVKDSTMEMLADKGNGNYAYIDSVREAHKVLVREAGSTLVTIAKDVKLQIEFNPARVESYRLIGYENRVLAARDFNDDKKDAGEIGAGHTVTALYEVVPRVDAAAASEVDALKYQAERPLTGAAASDELLTVKLRYKRPDADHSKRLSRVVRDHGTRLNQASTNFRWSAAVAGFGMLLRASEHRGNATLEMVMRLAEGAMGRDREGDRHELLGLMRSAGALGLDTRG